jgi:hypothetical protein
LGAIKVIQRKLPATVVHLAPEFEQSLGKGGYDCFSPLRSFGEDLRTLVTSLQQNGKDKVAEINEAPMV